MAQYILFDFDGTVYDTVEGIAKSVRYALAKFGIQAELEELTCFAGPPLVDMFREKYGVSLERALELTAAFRERYRPIGLYESRPFPGIQELLEALKAAGKKTGIATTKPQVLAEELLERAGLLEYFDVICGSGPEGDLPKWQLVRRAMEALDARAEETVLVGDTKYDALGARRCGVDFIGAGYGYGAGGMTGVGTKRIVPSVEELKELLLS